jgi:hypothetical protein
MIRPPVSSTRSNSSLSSLSVGQGSSREARANSNTTELIPLLENARADEDAVPASSVSSFYKRSTAFTISVQKYVKGRNWGSVSSYLLAGGIITYVVLLADSVFKDKFSPKPTKPKFRWTHLYEIIILLFFCKAFVTFNLLAIRQYQEFNHRQIYVLAESLLLPLTCFVANSIGITLTRLDSDPSASGVQVQYVYCLILGLYFMSLFIPARLEAKHQSSFKPFLVGTSCYVFHLLTHLLCVIHLTYNVVYCNDSLLSFCFIMSLTVWVSAGCLLYYSQRYDEDVELSAFNLTLFQLFGVVSLLQYRGT